MLKIIVLYFITIDTNFFESGVTMKYSYYSFKELMKVQIFEQIYNMFMAIPIDFKTRLKLKSVLEKGGYNGFAFESSYSIIGGYEIVRRISWAYLLMRNPETFDLLVKNKVNLFHGTNGNALINILKYGLNSYITCQEKGLEIQTGEEINKREGKIRDFISLTDILDLAEYYSSFGITGENNELNFPVIIGISSNSPALNYDKIASVRPQLPEIPINYGLPTESFNTILVPSDKVEFVKKLVGQMHVNVSSLDYINDKFFNIDFFYDNGIMISSDKYYTFLQGFRTTNKKFTYDEVREFVLGMKRIFDGKGITEDSEIGFKR